MADVAPADAGSGQIAAAEDYPELGPASYALGLLFVAYIFSFIDRQILALLVGPIREDFGISDFQYSLLQGAAFALLYTFAGLPIGRLADRYSRRLIISTSVFFWSLTTVGCGRQRLQRRLRANDFLYRIVGHRPRGLCAPFRQRPDDAYCPLAGGTARRFLPGSDGRVVCHHHAKPDAWPDDGAVYLRHQHPRHGCRDERACRLHRLRLSR